MSGIVHANSGNFEEVVKSKKVVLVDFFASWCGPCKMLTPVLEEIVKGNETEAVIAKLDIDESLDVAKEFGVMSVPTMIFFKDGEECERLVGLRGKQQIVEELKKYYSEEE